MSARFHEAASAIPGRWRIRCAAVINELKLDGRYRTFTARSNALDVAGHFCKIRVSHETARDPPVPMNGLHAAGHFVACWQPTKRHLQP